MSHSTDDLLTANEVAAILKISRSTVYKMIHRGELPPPLHVGGGSRWRRSDIEQVLDQVRKLNPPHRPGDGAVA